LTFREAGAVILKIAYGYNIETHRQDPLVDLADVSMSYFSLVGSYGTWLVDVIPICRNPCNVVLAIKHN
jgi:hypothetical protein